MIVRQLFHVSVYIIITLLIVRGKLLRELAELASIMHHHYHVNYVTLFDVKESRKRNP